MTSFVLSRLRRAGALALLSAAAGSASAHIGYGSGLVTDAGNTTSRNFGVLTIGSGATASNRSLTSNFGWADASDLGLSFDSSFATTRSATSDAAGWAAGGFATGVDNLYFGDSHKGTAFRFHLDSTLTVNLSLNGLSGVTGTAGALTPGFSVYKGLAAVAPLPASQTGVASSADHDFGAASQAVRTLWSQLILGPGYDYRATQGSWNALGNWYIGGDGDAPGSFANLSFFQYVGSAFSTQAGGAASTSLLLGPGDYTVFVGGNDLASKTASQAGQRFGYALSVSAVPEPSTWLLMLAGVPLLVLRRRRAG